MAGNTVAELNRNLLSFTDELTVLTASIKDSLTEYGASGTRKAVSQDYSLKKDIRDFNEQADTHDRQFEEEEARLQAYGGKSRKQTLQEFILLFFFVAYGILIVAFVLYANRVGMDSTKIFGIMIFMLLILAGIIISYA
jgi:hypothetical protein